MFDLCSHTRPCAYFNALPSLSWNSLNKELCGLYFVQGPTNYTKGEGAIQAGIPSLKPQMDFRDLWFLWKGTVWYVCAFTDLPEKRFMNLIRFPEGPVTQQMTLQVGADGCWEGELGEGGWRTGVRDLVLIVQPSPTFLTIAYLTCSKIK